MLKSSQQEGERSGTHLLKAERETTKLLGYTSSEALDKMYSNDNKDTPFPPRISWLFGSSESTKGISQ